MRKDEIKKKLYALVKVTNEGDNVSVIRSFDKEADYIIEYADEFACGFAEWKVDNAFDFCEANSVYGQSLKRGEWIYFKDGHKDRIVTTTELLEIYKQQINGL